MSDYPPNMTVRPIDAWPRPLTINRAVSPFTAKYGSTLKLLDRELRLLDPKDTRYPPTVLQVALRERDFRISDGMPRADARPSHPGVIVSIEPRNKPRMSIPCDTFTRWQDNLRGIAMSMEALRMMERYGCVWDDQQYRGWQALEAAPAVSVISAARSLLARTAYPDESPERQGAWANQMADSPVVATTVLRQARGNAHPDRHGGDQTIWDQVQQAASVLRLTDARAL